MSTASREEAIGLLDDYIETMTQGFIHVARTQTEHPTDRHLQTLMARTVIELDRFVRLREGLRSGPTRTPSSSR